LGSNPSWGKAGGHVTASPNPDRYADYFKIKALDFTMSAVPEPSTWVMMILGVGMVGASMRRRRLEVSQAAVA
jgi:hypothetical protein